MPNDNILKFGVLRTRDLVELYYGWRLVGRALPPRIFASIITTPVQLLTADPRRYAYLISFGASGGNTATSYLGPSADVSSSNGIEYFCASGVQNFFERNFRKHLDTVCDELWIVSNGNGLFASVQEFVLTTAPVDEVPLG